MSSSNSLESTTRLHFGVFKYNVRNVLQARILEFDFEAHVIRNIKQDKVKRSFKFADLVKIEETSHRGTAGVALHFKEYPHPYELYCHSQAESESLFAVVFQIKNNNYDLAMMPQKVFLEGHMDKQGSSKVWKKRYLRLYEGRLLCFTNEKTATPINVVSLFGLKINPESQRVIELHSPHRVYRFRTSDKPHRDNWYTHLLKASGFRPAQAHNPEKVIFGTALKELLSRAEFQEPDTPLIPPVILDGAKYVEKFGLDEEGIFRISGIKDDILRIQRQYDIGADFDFEKAVRGSVHTAAGLMTLYLRELPEPVIPYEAYDKIVAAGNLPKSERPAHLIPIIRSIPIERRRLLIFMLKLMAKIEALKDVNKMSASNLAIVFRSCFLKNRGKPLMGEFQVAITAITDIIEIGIDGLFEKHDPARSLVFVPITESSESSPPGESENGRARFPSRGFALPGMTLGLAPKLSGKGNFGQSNKLGKSNQAKSNQTKPNPIKSNPPSPSSTTSHRDSSPPQIEHPLPTHEQEGSPPPHPGRPPPAPPRQSSLPNSPEPDVEEPVSPPTHTARPVSTKTRPPSSFGQKFNGGAAEELDSDSDSDIGEDAEEISEDEEEPWWDTCPAVSCLASNVKGTLPKRILDAVAVPLLSSPSLDTLRANPTNMAPIPGALVPQEKIDTVGEDNIPTLQPWTPPAPRRRIRRVRRTRTPRKRP